MQTCITQVQSSSAAESIHPASSGTGESATNALPSEHKVKANGTWQSVIAWSRKANLDTEQQTAFEIMASTYVLTFINEAEPDTEDATEVEEQRKCLQKLARHEDDASKPLCLFVTGPAGAGKCESPANVFVCACDSTSTLPFLMTTFPQQHCLTQWWHVANSLAN